MEERGKDRGREGGGREERVYFTVWPLYQYTLVSFKQKPAS